MVSFSEVESHSQVPDCFVPAKLPFAAAVGSQHLALSVAAFLFATLSPLPGVFSLHGDHALAAASRFVALPGGGARFDAIRAVRPVQA